MDVKQIIISSLIKSIQDTGKIAFQRSQVKCPVITGELKHSGSETNIENGITINYSKEYASFVNKGTKAGNRHVPSHRRKGKAVKAYTYYSHGSKAHHFIDGPLKETFDNEFAQNFSNNLTNNLSGKARIQRS